MKTVKISFNGPREAILRQTKLSDGIWGDYRFIVNEPVKECDYWFVYSKGSERKESTIVPENNVFLLTGEPVPVYHYAKKYLKQFPNILTTRNDINFNNTVRHQPCQPWWVGRLNGFKANSWDDFPLSFNEISTASIQKRKELCVITSRKAFTRGHVNRLKFVKSLTQILGSEIDIYGQGFNPFNDKWDILTQYKYHIVIENTIENDYWTEKLADAFLAECFPIYLGAPNITKYFDQMALHCITNSNVKSAANEVRNIIKNNWYEKRHNHILIAKQQILDKYNILPSIIRIIENHSPPSTAKHISILGEKKYFDPSKIGMVIHRMLLNNLSREI